MKKKRLGKLVLSGSLVLALSIPAVASASAASDTTSTAANPYSVNYSWSKLASQYGIDLDSIFKQIQNGNWYTGTTGGSTGNTGSGSTGNSGSASTGNTGSGSTGNTGSTGGNYGSGNSDSNGGNYGYGNSGSTGSNTGTTGGNSGSTSGNTGSNSGSVATQSDYASQVVALVNKERAAVGLSALKTDAKLTQVAVAKAKDMYNNNYFDHTSPTYGSPFDMMKQYGVSFSYAGENIAKGQQNPQAVMTAWMNSAGHKANILKSNFTSIGVAYYNGVWVQEFTG